MALTNFANLTTEQKTVWSMDLWRQARNFSFVNRFLGNGPNAMIQHVTELKQSEKGARAVITLLADLTGDGVAGDRTLEGNEEAMQTFDQVIRVDQLRNANRAEGRIANQKSIAEFRGSSRDVLAYWLSDRIDQLAFLTLSGVDYKFTNRGALRKDKPGVTASDLQFLEFNADIAAPSAARRLRWDGTTNHALVASAATSAVVSTDTPSWEMFVALKAYAKEHYVRGIKEAGNEETYHAFLTPTAMQRLKNDATYMANLRYAQSRDNANPLFTGGTVKIDGIYLHEFRHVYNTSAASGGTLITGGGVVHSKWGSAGDTEGCQVLFCGAQALGFADIGAPTWVEKEFDYENQPSISTGKILGLLKPKFGSIYEPGTSVEDFGVITCYCAQ